MPATSGGRSTSLALKLKFGGGPTLSAKEMYWLRSAAGRDVAFGDLLADFLAEGMIAGRIEVRVIAGGVDGREHGEQGGAGIELPRLGRCGTGGEGDRQDGW